MENLESDKSDTLKTIEYYYSHNRYLDFLKSTKVYKDLYRSKEALLCILLSILATSFIVYIVYLNPTKDSSDKLLNLLTLSIGSITGLLGFIIGGLALIVGSIGKKLIDTINDSGKIVELLSIVYRFYFLGSILGGAITIHLFSYLLLLIPFEFNFIFLFCIVLISSYAFFFSLTSSIMLMGSCIRLMILQYSIESTNK
ncbi:hypothetical protein ACI3RH_08150 [Lactococcus lactis]